MSRRHRAEKREILPDAKFGDVVLSKFINIVMRDGKKSTAESIVYGALDMVQSRASSEPVKTFLLPVEQSGDSQARKPLENPLSTSLDSPLLLPPLRS